MTVLKKGYESKLIKKLIKFLKYFWLPSNKIKIIQLFLAH